MLTPIRMMPFTSVLLLLLIVSVWLPLESEMGEVGVPISLTWWMHHREHYPGPPSETYLKCQEEVQAISCATLFSPVTRQEAVQAMSTISDHCCIILLTACSPGVWLVRQRLVKWWSCCPHGDGAL